MKEIPAIPSIGPNVRKIRKLQKLSLDELAKKSGVSKAMLSQIETDKVNPTIATGWKIAHALGIDFNALLRGEEEKIRIFEINRANDITSLDTDEEGAHIKVLSPISTAENLEIYILTFEARGTLHSSPHYAGTEEFLTVIKGEVKVTAGGKEAVLNPGDTLRYECDIEHSIENLSENSAEIYLVVHFPAP